MFPSAHNELVAWSRLLIRAHRAVNRTFRESVLQGRVGVDGSGFNDVAPTGVEQHRHIVLDDLLGETDAPAFAPVFAVVSRVAAFQDRLRQAAKEAFTGGGIAGKFRTTHVEAPKAHGRHSAAHPRLARHILEARACCDYSFERRIFADVSGVCESDRAGPRAADDGDPSVRTFDSFRRPIDNVLAVLPLAGRKELDFSARLAESTRSNQYGNITVFGKVSIHVHGGGELHIRNVFDDHRKAPGSALARFQIGWISDVSVQDHPVIHRHRHVINDLDTILGGAGLPFAARIRRDLLAPARGRLSLSIHVGQADTRDG